MSIYEIYHGADYSRVFATRIKTGWFNTKLYNGDEIVAVVANSTIIIKE